MWWKFAQNNTELLREYYQKKIRSRDLISKKSLTQSERDELFSVINRLEDISRGFLNFPIYNQMRKELDKIKRGYESIQIKPIEKKDRLEVAPTQSEATPTQSEATPTQSEVAPTQSEVKIDNLESLLSESEKAISKIPNSRGLAGGDALLHTLDSMRKNPQYADFILGDLVSKYKSTGYSIHPSQVVSRLYNKYINKVR